MLSTYTEADVVKLEQDIADASLVIAYNATKRYIGRILNLMREPQSSLLSFHYLDATERMYQACFQTAGSLPELFLARVRRIEVLIKIIDHSGQNPRERFLYVVEMWPSHRPISQRSLLLCKDLQSEYCALSVHLLGSVAAIKPEDSQRLLQPVRLSLH